MSSEMQPGHGTRETACACSGVRGKDQSHQAGAQAVSPGEVPEGVALGQAQARPCTQPGVGSQAGVGSRGHCGWQGADILSQDRCRWPAGRLAEAQGPGS